MRVFPDCRVLARNFVASVVRAPLISQHPSRGPSAFSSISNILPLPFPRFGEETIPHRHRPPAARTVVATAPPHPSCLLFDHSFRPPRLFSQIFTLRQSSSYLHPASHSIFRCGKHSASLRDILRTFGRYLCEIPLIFVVLSHSHSHLHTPSAFHPAEYLRSTA